MVNHCFFFRYSLQPGGQCSSGCALYLPVSYKSSFTIFIFYGGNLKRTIFSTSPACSLPPPAGSFTPVAKLHILVGNLLTCFRFFILRKYVPQYKCHKNFSSLVWYYNFTACGLVIIPFYGSKIHFFTRKVKLMPQNWQECNELSWSSEWN